MKRYLLGFLLTGVFASPVFSQEQVIEEVIVTVTAKEESSQDLPISITALSSSDIEARQVQDIISLSQQVPGFTTSKAIGNGSKTAITEPITGIKFKINVKLPKMNANSKPKNQ